MILLLGKGEGLQALTDVFAGEDAVALTDAGRTPDELCADVRSVLEVHEFEFAVANGLSCAKALDVLDGVGVPTVGATTQDWHIEMDKPFGKKLCAEVGVGTSEWWTVDLADLDETEWEFPCYVKHRKAIGGTTSFKVHSKKQIRNLIRAYGYERGFIVELPLAGIEFSMNALIGAENWQVIGCNYDMKGPTGKVVGNAYGAAGEHTAWIEGQLAPLFQAVCGMGYRGVLAVTVFMTDEGLRMIELNVRVGTGSGYTYLNNVSNMADMLRACALGQSIPAPQFKHLYGLSVTVDSGLRREAYDLEVGLLEPLGDGVVLVENNVYDGMSNGAAPYLLVGFGDSSLQSVGETLMENLRCLDVPLMSKPELDLDRFDRLAEVLPR